MNSSDYNPFDHIPTLHALYCRLTGQTLILNRYDRQRQWHELLRAGFTARDVERVIKYLQCEIRNGRRNPGALKLSNLLQPDRFEEDLNLSRVRLQSPTPTPPIAQPELTPAAEEIRRQECTHLREFRLGLRNHGATLQTTTAEPDPTLNTPQINSKSVPRII